MAAGWRDWALDALFLDFCFDGTCLVVAREERTEVFLIFCALFLLLVDFLLF